MKNLNIRKKLVSLLVAGSIMLTTSPIIAQAQTNDKTPMNPYVIEMGDYDSLTTEGRQLYKQVIDAIRRGDKELEVPGDPDLRIQMYDALQDSMYGEFVTIDPSGLKEGKLVFVYKYDLGTQTQMIDFIENEMSTILDSLIQPEMNDLDKMLVLYKYFGTRISYNDEYADRVLGGEDLSDIKLHEGLSTNKGVCHTYAYLLDYCLNQLGIKTYQAMGRIAGSGVYHQWIVAELDGEYYNFDLTWDRNLGYGVSLDFFGETDFQRAVDGIYERSYVEHECTDKSLRGLQGATSYSYVEDHIFEISYGYETQYYNTNTKEFSETFEKGNTK